MALEKARKGIFYPTLWPPCLYNELDTYRNQTHLNADCPRSQQIQPCTQQGLGQGVRDPTYLGVGGTTIQGHRRGRDGVSEHPPS